MTKVSLAALFATCVLLAGVRGSASARQAAPASQQPAFKTSTVLVQVDAIVTDKSRAFVPDLNLNDFEVSEDGVPQAVEQIYLALDPAMKTARVSLPAGTRPSTFLNPSLAAPPADDAKRTFVLLFDLDDMQPAAVGRARDAALKFLGDSFRPGDIGGVVTNGRMVNNRLTEDRSELEAAVKDVKPSGEARSRDLDLREWPRLLGAWEVYQIAVKNDRSVIQAAEQRACADDPDACKRGVTPDVVGKAQRLLPDFRNRGQAVMRAVTALAGGLRRLPGRKTIILLTDGFFVEDEWADLRRVADEANRASVRIYSLDTRGLNRGTASSQILDMGPHAAQNPAGDLPGSITGIDIGQDGPTSLAVDTGGLAIRNENDFPRALAEIASDTSSYYVLGYRSTNTRLDGKFRSITVRVRRSGLTVRARKGYLATADLAAPSTGTGAPGATAPAAPAGAPAAAPTPQPAVPTAAPPPMNPEVAAVAPANKAPGTAGEGPGLLRLQPDVKDRVAKLDAMAPGGDARNTAARADMLARARAGWEAYQRGDVRAAKTQLSTAAAAAGAPPWVRYTLGWSEFALGEHQAAAAEWEKVRGAVPEFEPVYFDLADSYLQQRDFGKALDVLREAEKRWPKDVDVYNAIGVVQTGRYAFGDAIKTFEKAVAVKADDSTANYNLARVCELRYIQAQRLKGVSRSTTEMFTKDRDCAVTYYRRTVDLNGLFVEESRAGLRRLENER